MTEVARPESVLQRRLTLGDLLDTSTFGELVKSFAELYKLGVKVFDESNRLADIKIGNGDSAATSSPSPRAVALHPDRGPGEGKAISTSQSARPPRRHKGSSCTG
jgi:hypothetical protein